MTKSHHPDFSIDERFMQRAIELAKKGRGKVEPNPMVGCVLEREGEVLGEGYHQRFGGPHAEIEAISSLPTAISARGATAYVSLEPCCHHGKTPPCTESLIQAGVRRVVFAMEDPFPKVSGGGAEQLRQAGIEVVSDVLGEQAACLNAPYMKRVRTGKPWVIAKWAMTVDGKIATRSGNSQWITNPSSRIDVHQTRSRVDGILTGMGTVRSDNPSLNARLPSEQGAPSRVAGRVVYCRNNVPSETSKLMTSARQIPLHLIAHPKIPESELETAASHGARIHRITATDPNEMINESLSLLGRQGMTNVLLEAGAELLGSFSDQGAIDELHVFIGPLLFGNRDAPSPIGGKGFETLAQASQLKLHSIDQFEDDVKLTYQSKVSRK